MTAPAIGWALLVIATGAAWMLSGTGWRLPSLPSLFKPGKLSANPAIDTWARMELIEAIEKAESEVQAAQIHLESLKQQAFEFSQELLTASGATTSAIAAKEAAK